MSLSSIDKNYVDTLNSIKSKIKTAQIKAALAVNAEMLCLYWDIGKTILERQQNEGWAPKLLIGYRMICKKLFQS